MLDRIFAAESAALETLKDDPGRSVLKRVAVDGRQFVVKRYRVPWWKTRLLHPLRLSQVWREYRGAQRLARVGCRASIPLAIVCQHDRGREAQALILPYIEGTSLDRLLEQAPPAAQWSNEYRQKRLQLARVVGGQIQRLLAARIVNRDCKLSNLIMDEACEHRGAEPVMIDPLGLRRRRSRRQVMRMLAVLLRTSLRAGPVTVREGMTCLRAALSDRPASAVARQVLALSRRGG